MAIEIKYENGATPLDENELKWLIPWHLTLQKELNDWEALNMVKWRKWWEKSKFEILSEQYINRLHKEMFCDTWDWAWKYRTSNKNIGVDYKHIPMELRNLIDDVKYWLNSDSIDEKRIAIRLHHRLVKIHLYANWNWRHARLVADIFLKKRNLNPIVWKQELRNEYIDALKKADDNDYGPIEELLM